MLYIDAWLPGAGGPWLADVFTSRKMDSSWCRGSGPTEESAILDAQLKAENIFDELAEAARTGSIVCRSRFTDSSLEVEE